MAAVGEYLIRVCCAAVLCALISGFLDKKGMLGASTKLLTGIFMVVTLLGPLVNLRVTGIENVILDVEQDADDLAASGENSAREAMAAIIKERTEAYILDKAKALGASLTVVVSLNTDDIPTPNGVHLVGSVSPYAKKRLTDIIQGDLGISAEAQTWN